MRRAPRSTVALSLLVALVAGCESSGRTHPQTRAGSLLASAAEPSPRVEPTQAPAPAPVDPSQDDHPTGVTQPAPAPPPGLSAATFAGGCFWCLEDAFEHLPGVREVLSGYTGGPEQHPSYDDVSNHRTGHAEAIRVHYDPRAVTYEQLLELYWRRVDPIHEHQSFVDWGRQYRSVIFVHTAEQRAAARRSLDAIVASRRFEAPVLTTLEDAPVFWVAERYHQDFWRTHPERYRAYHEHSGRREFLRAHWGPDAAY